MKDYCYDYSAAQGYPYSESWTCSANTVERFYWLNSNCSDPLIGSTFISNTGVTCNRYPDYTGDPVTFPDGYEYKKQELSCKVETISPTLSPSPALPQSIIDLIAADPTLSTFLTALWQDDGDSIIVLSGPGPFTVFAPTNDGFAKFQGLIDSELLLYHILGAEYLSGDLPNGNTPVATLNTGGEEITIMKNDTALYVKDAIGRIAVVTSSNLAATNGVVYIIDIVLEYRGTTTEHPSNNPTTPSSAPSNNPSLFPSRSPSFQPSLAPTYSPSRSPSYSPTFSPSLAPTYSPSLAPSHSPTLAPSLAPTYSPTLAPSHAPSLAPSLAPSYSPTACPDDNPNILSNDGIDIIANSSKEISGIFSNIVNISEVYTTLNQSYSIDYYDEIFADDTVACNDSADICHVGCSDKECLFGTLISDTLMMEYLLVDCIGRYSCYSMDINIIDSDIENIFITCDRDTPCKSMSVEIIDSMVGFLQIQCYDEYSCDSLDFSIIGTESKSLSYIQHISFVCETSLACKTVNYKMENVLIHKSAIICNDDYACNDTSIYLSNSSYDHFNIYCIESRACKGMDVNVFDNMLLDNVPYQFSIDCFVDNSCEDLTIDMYPNISMELNMNRFSENVQIVHQNIDEINITCGDEDDNRYIRYNLDEIKTDDQLRDLGRKEYESRRFPCDNIKIDCTSNPFFPSKLQI